MMLSGTWRWGFALGVLGGCQASLDLDAYVFEAGAAGLAGSAGPDAGGGGSAGNAVGGDGGDGEAGANLGGGGADASGGGGAGDAGAGSGAGDAPLAFAHYSFAVATAPYEVATEVGLLQPGNGLVGVQPGTLTTRRGGSVALRADGGFSYAPVNALAWGDDHFTFADAQGAPAGAARISLQPGVVRGLSSQQPELGNGFAIDGPPRVAGDSAERYTGEQLASAGDVNGDGLDDVVVTGSGLSRSFVVFGKADPSPVRLPTLLESMPEAAGFVIDTSAVGGRAASGAGDVNGDGFDDILLGTPGSAAYAAFIVYGSAAPTSLTLPDSTPGRSAVIAIIRSDVPGTDAADVGRTVAAAGDVNGDGFGDVAIGGANLETPGAVGGAAYVVFGRPGLESVPLYRDFEEFQSDGLGFAIHGGDVPRGAGDVNGDGLSDLIIGAASLEAGLPSPRGAACVVFGKQDDAAVPLANVAAGVGGFAIYGAAAGNDGTGLAVAGAGDVNGDGLADLIVGTPLASGAMESHGGAFIVFGKTDTVSVSSEALGAQGFAITSPYAGASVGNSVASGEDFNGDGLSDVVLGTREALVGEQIGAAFLVFGKRDPGAVSLASLETGQLDGVALLGTASGRTFVSGGGDVNGDGLADVLVAGAWSDAFVGHIYALFGWDASDRLQLRRAVLAGGRGDDTLDFTGTPLVAVIGGPGYDTLRFVGADHTLDLRQVPRALGIEHVDLRGSGDNRLLLDDAVVRRLPQNRAGVPGGLSRTLVLSGDAGDRVELDLGAYTPGPSNAGRDVWLRTGAVYGVEATPGLIVAPE